MALGRSPLGTAPLGYNKTSQAATQALYRGVRTRAQVYLGTRADAEVYRGPNTLFP